MTPEPFEEERERMIADQLLRRGIQDPRVMEAFRRVPRHRFVPADRQSEAYGDYPISVGEGQTISQPYIVALTLQLLRLEPGMKVLEIGTGSGYQTALLARLGARVYSMERVASLAETACARLEELKVDSITIRIGDGSLGWPEEAPFDAIVVSAAAPALPVRLVEQLKEGGRMAVPIGGPFEQTLTLVEKRRGEITSQLICSCVFVPLVGQGGWEPA